MSPITQFFSLRSRHVHGHGIELRKHFVRISLSHRSVHTPSIPFTQHKQNEWAKRNYLCDGKKIQFLISCLLTTDAFFFCHFGISFVVNASTFASLTPHLAAPPIILRFTYYLSRAYDSLLSRSLARVWANKLKSADTRLKFNLLEANKI